MLKWQPISISEKLFTNVQEVALTKASAAIENCFVNEAGGHTRFPGLIQRATFPFGGRVYLDKWRTDLIAVVNGQMYRIDQNFNATNVTGVPIGGGRRPTFASTEKEMAIAAGGDIISFKGATTELLSAAAPKSSHVGYMDGYLLANDLDSNSFQHSAANGAASWNPLDIFAANVKPDNVNSLVVSPYSELLVCGTESIEQYERLQTGVVPFFRRWTTGEGLFSPYTLVSDKDGNWGINNRYEFVRFTGQSSQSASDAIGKSLESVDDWTDAWARQMNLTGQKFMVLQIPQATNVYGTKGITLALDYRQSKWLSLFGWDSDNGLPARWPGWSYQPMWGRHFVGGEGKLYELSNTVYTNDGAVQRVLGRTAHISRFGECEVVNVRMSIKRGVGSNTIAPTISLRCLKDNKTYTRWVQRSLGRTGERAMTIEFGGMGECHTFQMEWFVTDDCEVEIRSMDAQIASVGT